MPPSAITERSESLPTPGSRARAAPTACAAASSIPHHARKGKAARRADTTPTRMPTPRPAHRSRPSRERRGQAQHHWGPPPPSSAPRQRRARSRHPPSLATQPRLALRAHRPPALGSSRRPSSNNLRREDGEYDKALEPQTQRVANSRPVCPLNVCPLNAPKHHCPRVARRRWARRGTPARLPWWRPALLLFPPRGVTHRSGPVEGAGRRAACLPERRDGAECPTHRSCPRPGGCPRIPFLVEQQNPPSDLVPLPWRRRSWRRRGPSRHARGEQSTWTAAVRGAGRTVRGGRCGADGARHTERDGGHGVTRRAGPGGGGPGLSRWEAGGADRHTWSGQRAAGATDRARVRRGQAAARLLTGGGGGLCGTGAGARRPGSRLAGTVAPPPPAAGWARPPPPPPGACAPDRSAQGRWRPEYRSGAPGTAAPGLHLEGWGGKGGGGGTGRAARPPAQGRPTR